MVEIEQAEAVSLLGHVGKEAWLLYSGLRFLAKDSVVVATHDGLANVLAVSVKFVQRHIKTLQETNVAGQPLVKATRTPEGYSYEVAAIKVKRGSAMPIAVPTKKKESPTNEVFSYWLEQYLQSYGSTYQVTNFAKEKGHVRKLVQQYGGDIVLLKAIIDVVIRLYPVKWKSAQFSRPTLGALVSWLAREAEPLARANQEIEDDKEIVITDEDGSDVFDAYDKKMGLST